MLTIEFNLFDNLSCLPLLYFSANISPFDNILLMSTRFHTLIKHGSPYNEMETSYQATEKSRLI